MPVGEWPGDMNPEWMPRNEIAFMAGQETMPKSEPRLANRFELEGMYEHLGDVLKKIGFLNPQNPEHWMLNVRRLFSRHGLRARETQVIKGICRQIDWYVRTRLVEGTKGSKEGDYGPTS